MLLTEHTHSYTDTGGEGRIERESERERVKERKKERGKKKGKGCERREGEQITAGRTVRMVKDRRGSGGVRRGCEGGGCMEVKEEEVGERVKKQACERGHTLGKAVCTQEVWSRRVLGCERETRPPPEILPGSN